MCPRCKGPMREPQAHNALSRLDNETYICSSCGRDEAMYNWNHRGLPLPPLDQLAV